MLNTLIGKIKKSSLLKRYLEPIILNSIEDFNYDKKIIGSFSDSFNNKHTLYSGLRNKLKPGWQNMFNETNKNKIPSPSELKTSLIEAKRNLKDFKNILNSFSIDLKENQFLKSAVITE